MQIAPDDPERPDIRALLDVHVGEARANSPPGESFALDHSELCHPDISFWSVRERDGTLIGCGALKQLGGGLGEVKSMHTRADQRGRGTGRTMLKAIIEEAQGRGLSALYLETGNNDAYRPARELYARCGFVECGAFGDYRNNGFSVFMRLDLPVSDSALRSPD